jgi:hypothetical protein
MVEEKPPTRLKKKKGKTRAELVCLERDITP